MTKTYNLLIREIDRRVFDALKKGEKTIETRAATKKYRKVKEKDVLNFVCGQESLQKTVGKVFLFKTIEEMVEKIDYNRFAKTPHFSAGDEGKARFQASPEDDSKAVESLPEKTLGFQPREAYKKIMPFVSSINEMKEVYFSFPNYEEKIKEFGLVAFELS